jgi:hypothetical protein
MAELHPLRVLPTSDLVAFAKSLCEDDARGAQFIKALEAYVNSKRGGLRVLDRFGQSVRRVEAHRLFHAQELQLWNISLKNIMEELLQGETPQPLVTTKIAMTVEDWTRLGVVDFEDLILRVAKPHTLKRWYGPKDWETFVEGIHKNESMVWDGYTWLRCVDHLDKLDYSCMGIALSFWFDHDPVLFGEAIACAHDWIDRLTAAEWKECAQLESRHYVQLAGVANSSNRSVSSSSSGSLSTGAASSKNKDPLKSWV